MRSIPFCVSEQRRLICCWCSCWSVSQGVRNRVEVPISAGSLSLSLSLSLTLSLCLSHSLSLSLSLTHTLSLSVSLSLSISLSHSLSLSHTHIKYTTVFHWVIITRFCLVKENILEGSSLPVLTWITPQQ